MALPLGMSLIPFIRISFFPRNDMMELSIVILLPIAAALMRCGLGADVMRERLAGRLPWGRQLMLALAILVLMLFEIVTAALTFASKVPLMAWAFPAALYGCYFLVIRYAFVAIKHVPVVSSDA